MQKSYGLPFSKIVPDIYLNIGHFLDHFIMLIFAKAPMMLAASLVLVMTKLLPMGHLALFFLVAWRRLRHSLPINFPGHY